MGYRRKQRFSHPNDNIAQRRLDEFDRLVATLMYGFLLALDEMVSTPISNCQICGTPVPGYVPEFCCNGFECGCEGGPIEPCLCSDCWAKL